MKKRHIQTKTGFALLLSMIVSSIVLAIGVAILQITVSQINLASTARESEIAFQAASAGVECLMYWRNELSAYAYPNPVSAPPAPDIFCFGNGPTSVNSNVIQNGVYQYDYSFGAGMNNDNCVKTQLYVMTSPPTASLTYNFSAIGSGIGDDTGQKVCPAGRVCNVLISAGHNRSCADLGTSIFTVQRELTVEF